VTIPKTGQSGNVGVVVTKTLIIVGDPSVTTTPDHPRGAMLRAYNKQTGEQVGAVFIPAPQSGSPMTYSVDGKQYVVVAIDLNNGNTIWRVPHGDTPDNVRNHPALQGMTIPKTGQSGSVGLMVTKTLVVAGDPQVTAPPGRPRGAMLRAYDKKSGQEVGAVLMPAPQSGSPMTYSVDGRQYMVVAVSGGNFSGEYIAFALPQNEIRSTNQQQH
jgi:quinoprotein glucose dehydrogenase